MTFSIVAFGASACGGDDATHPDGGISPDVGERDATVVAVELLDPSFVAHPTGALVYQTKDRMIVADESGVRARSALDGELEPEAVLWAASSTAAGSPAASALVVDEQLGFFFPTGQPQVGAFQLGASSSGLIGEGVLATPLEGSFPADLELDAAANVLWVSDAPFGAGSTVRGYATDAFATESMLVQTIGAELPATDLDGDGSEEILIAGKLSLAPKGKAILVAFTVLGNTAARVAGGVMAFDRQTGAALGRIVVPVVDSSTSALGFVSGLAVTEDQLLVVSAEKRFAPRFEELGGQLFAYDVLSWDPLSIASEPRAQIRTGLDNPVGLSTIDNVAIVVEAPFFEEGSVEVFDHRGSISRMVAHPVDAFYVDGFSVPGDPVSSPDGTSVMVFSEAGVLKLGISR